MSASASKKSEALVVRPAVGAAPRFYLRGYVHVGLASPWGNFSIDALAHKLEHMGWFVDPKITQEHLDRLYETDEPHHTLKLYEIGRQKHIGGIYLTPNKEVLVPRVLGPVA
jgi:hypothetical protein